MNLKSEETSSNNFKILAVDDEQPSLNAINRTLRRHFDVILSINADAALEVMKKEKIAVILADQRMPGLTGVELFQKAINIQPHAVRILITGYTDIEATIQAINEGQVYYYINKPWEPEELRLIVKRAAEHHQLLEDKEDLMEELRQANERLEQENIILRNTAEEKFEFENIVGNSQAMQKVFQLMRKVIPTDTSVLLIGETGTGKELIARAIHYNGPRQKKLFVAQNCAALPDTLLESELFGHVKGAFTGATGEKKGLFEVSDGGTVFLDEVADTSAAFQQRLLRVLQEGEIRPVGAEKGIQVDVRIISATNRDLTEYMKKGSFREDLYYRLNVFPINIPPLRQRKEDIPLLVKHFVKKYQEKLGKKIKEIDSKALSVLSSAPFPGNVRELENVIERAITLIDNNSAITAELISDFIDNEQTQLLSFLEQQENLKEITESIEKYYIVEKLKAHNGNITHTARSLGLSRVGLQKKLKRYGIKNKEKN
jgi:two-component system response regulator HupR/HoxA